jgi:circadian clock protein KaiB
MKGVVDSSQDFERAAADSSSARYLLRLYVAGATQKSANAIQNIRRICEGRLKGRYALEVIDVYQNPEAAREDQILAVPVLIKRLPLPLRRLLGDLSNEERVLLGLDLKAMEESAQQAVAKKPSRKR